MRSFISYPYFLFLGEQNLKKYQEESTKVSNVSVSLVTFSPEESLVYFQVECLSKGFPTTLRSTSSGNNIGKSFFLTGNALPLSLYTIGIGHPQYLCLDTPQS